MGHTIRSKIKLFRPFGTNGSNSGCGEMNVRDQMTKHFPSLRGTFANFGKNKAPDRQTGTKKVCTKMAFLFISRASFQIPLSEKQCTFKRLLDPLKCLFVVLILGLRHKSHLLTPIDFLNKFMHKYLTTI